jgi:hypothetical protein
MYNQVGRAFTLGFGGAVMMNRLGLAGAVSLLLSIAMPAAGQYFVQQGNVLDANNRLGSGGLNYGGASPYRPNQTNRIVTGNVTAGTAFRGYSPVRDPNSFFLGAAQATAGTGVSGLIPGFGGGIGALPSDRLTTFRRDSVSINELRRLAASPNMAPLPYYSRTSTVADTGQILRGLNEPGTSQLQSSYVPLRRDLYTQPINPLDAARNSLVGTPLSVDTRLVRADTGRSLTGPVNKRLLGSPLFGGVREVPISKLTAQVDNGIVPPTTGLQSTTPQTPTTPEARRGSGGLRSEERSGSPLDRLLNQENRNVQAIITPNAGSAEQAQTQDMTGQGRLNRPIGAVDVASERDAGSLARPTRAASEATAPGTPGQGPSSLRQTYVQLGQEPLRTFTGTEDERINAHMAEAEKLLREQRYYDAARRYEMAHTIDLHNPLPLFGRAMSLLAAGDYVSSANDLFAAIEFARPAGAIQIDLQQFIPDLQTLDRRRAFLEKRLQIYEDFRLRFLLGWAEYMSGMPELGLANMQKGAKAAPESMDALRQFVQLLTARQATQPANAATRPG